MKVVFENEYIKICEDTKDYEATIENKTNKKIIMHMPSDIAEENIILNNIEIPPLDWVGLLIWDYEGNTKQAFDQRDYTLGFIDDLYDSFVEETGDEKDGEVDNNYFYQWWEEKGLIGGFNMSDSFTPKSEEFKDYTFKLCLCGGDWCRGTLTYKARSKGEANLMIAAEVGNKLYNAFPDLDIEFGWELVDEDDDEEEDD